MRHAWLPPILSLHACLAVPGTTGDATTLEQGTSAGEDDSATSTGWVTASDGSDADETDWTESGTGLTTGTESDSEGDGTDTSTGVDPPPLAPPPPYGIYSLNEVVDRPYVDGFVLRTGWSVLEPTEGAYNFGSIDQRIASLPAAQSLTLTVFVTTPAWLTARCSETFVGMFGETCVPWDDTMLLALDSFVSAMAQHEVDGVPLAEHPKVLQVDAGIGGIQSIRLITLPPGYSAERLEDGVFASTESWAAAFPEKSLFISLFAVNDGASNPTTAEDLRDKLLAEFDGLGKPRINFFIEYLTGAVPDTGSPLGKVIFDVHDQTSILMQACGEWSHPEAWSWCNWDGPSDSPESGFILGHDTFGTRYFELYPADLQNPAYTNIFEQWSEVLHQ
jgi:hypothetical protein